jgi:hypothetical protein
MEVLEGRSDMLMSPSGCACIKEELLSNLESRRRWDNVSSEHDRVPMIAIVVDRNKVGTLAQGKA